MISPSRTSNMENWKTTNLCNNSVRLPTVNCENMMIFIDLPHHIRDNFQQPVLQRQSETSLQLSLMLPLKLPLFPRSIIDRTPIRTANNGVGRWEMLQETSGNHGFLSIINMDQQMGVSCTLSYINQQLEHLIKHQ